MRFLRKMLWVLGVILVLAVLKIILQKHFPRSSFFHFNLLSCLQLLVLFWAIFTGILETTVWRRLPPRRAGRNSTLTFFALLVVAELICCWMFFHPAAIPRPFLATARYYYANYQRNIAQFDPAISQYDSSLFYRMIPNNRTTFSNVEFSDSIITDARGFRDTTNALAHSAILCLGDSYTLGWGVRQHEAYPYLLHQLLKVPVLNTGVSSYGTARELAAIRPIDKSALKAVIIQYCTNDEDENKAYVENGDRPLISPGSSYDSARTILKWSNAWFPFKYSLTQFKIFMSLNVIPSVQKAIHPSIQKTIHPSRPITDDTAQYEKETDLFLEVLKGADLNFDSVHIFVFDIDSYDQLRSKFISTLRNKLTQPAQRSIFKDHVHALHIEQLFTPDDYYILDEHIRPSGHAKLARLLADSILNRGT